MYYGTLLHNLFFFNQGIYHFNILNLIYSCIVLNYCQIISSLNQFYFGNSIQRLFHFLEIFFNNLFALVYLVSKVALKG